jgi:hypothetical protein
LRAASLAITKPPDSGITGIKPHILGALRLGKSDAVMRASARAKPLKDLVGIGGGPTPVISATLASAQRTLLSASHSETVVCQSVLSASEVNRICAEAGYR